MFQEKKKREKNSMFKPFKKRNHGEGNKCQRIGGTQLHVKKVLDMGSTSHHQDSPHMLSLGSNLMLRVGTSQGVGHGHGCLGIDPLI